MSNDTENKRRLLGIIGALGFGIFSAWGLPSEWFLRVFIFFIGSMVLLGFISLIRAEDRRPLDDGMQVISFLFIGTTRPGAIIKTNLTSLLFLLFASYVVGMGLGIIWLASI